VVTATGADDADSVGVSCTNPARAVGGGASTNDTTPGSGLLVSAPLEQYTTDNVAESGETPTGWFAEFDEISGSGTNTVTVYAICAS
jgi:hypothetical protein